MKVKELTSLNAAVIVTPTECALLAEACGDAVARLVENGLTRDVPLIETMGATFRLAAITMYSQCHMGHMTREELVRALEEQGLLEESPAKAR